MKNKLILILVLLACFIPSAVAYASYQQIQNAPVDANTAVEITISDVNGKTTTLTKEADGDEADQMIQFFLGLKANAQSIVGLPDSLLTQKSYHVTISSNVDKKENYEIYFSTDPTANYYVAPDGKTYKIAEADAKQFITSPYAESLYTASAMPKLTLSHTFDVTPDSAEWRYINYTGEFVEAEIGDMVHESLESYELEGGLNLEFDTIPDYCTVKITDADGNVLYEDWLSGLSAFTNDTTRQVTVDVEAKWYDDPETAFGGTLNYQFTTLVTAPAEFYIGMSTVKSGRFTAITAVNVSNPDKISFSSNMEPSIAPVFYSAGNNTAVGLLPIGTDVQSGLYTLTLTYGGTTEEIFLTVEYDGGKVSNYNVPQDTINYCLSDAAVSAFEKVCADLMATGDTTRHFSGSFLSGIPGSCSILRGFGRDITLNGASAASYRNNGVDYSAAAGQDVVAHNAGKVVYAGVLDYAGNIVVIEHGWGLKTWYYNMGSVDCKVGDTVQQGAKIGTTGQTGFVGYDSGFHAAMSVGNTFVSPYDTWSDSSVAGKVIIPFIDP